MKTLKRMKSDVVTPEIPKGWCEEEFSGVQFGDKRLDSRLYKLSEDLAVLPQAPINQACDDWSATKAAYHFFNNSKVSPEKIIQPHIEKTRERVQSHKRVLSIQDTCMVSYTHHPSKKGLGPVGVNKSSSTPGMLIHTAFVVTPEGLPLGILSQEIWTRDPENENEQEKQAKHERQKRPIEEKESYKWIKPLENTRGNINPETQIVHVGDRESDIYEFFMKVEELEQKYLIRSAQDRFINDDGSKLWDYMKQREIAGYTEVNIPQNSKRKSRTAKLSIRFEKVKLDIPRRFRTDPNKNTERYVTYAIYLKEINPPEDVDSIEWKLLTNVEVNNIDDALERISWYRRRWDVEEFHKILKSGCSIEDCRLETVERLSNFIALKSVIAWRIFWITKINRIDPKASCTTVLAEHEWKALYMKIHRANLDEIPEKPPSVREAIRWIGQLGGFLGRKGDKEPGITVIWRGWQRLYDFSDALLLLQKH